MSIDFRTEPQPVTRPIIRPSAPRICGTSIVDAYAKALDIVEPIFFPAQMHVDDRGWSLMNQLQGVLQPTGQVNFSVQHPGVIKAWHRHHFQTDFWIGLTGDLKVGVHCEVSERSWLTVVGERRPGVLVIPPTLWHGATAVGGRQAGLLYYVTRAYNTRHPDEERRDVDSLPGFPWEVQHR